MMDARVRMRVLRNGTKMEMVAPQNNHAVEQNVNFVLTAIVCNKFVTGFDKTGHFTHLPNFSTLTIHDFQTIKAMSMNLGVDILMYPRLCLLECTCITYGGLEVFFWGGGGGGGGGGGKGSRQTG